MKLKTQLKVFVLLTTVSTLLLTLLFLAVTLLPWDIAPEWLFHPAILTILGTVWFYSTLNTFNYLWLEKRDVLLDLTQGFSAISVLWTICVVFNLFQVSASPSWTDQLAQLVIILAVYLTLLRTLLNTRANVWSNITRWVGIIGASLFTGIHIVTLFVAISPANIAFDNIWNTVAACTICALFLTPILYYLPGKKTNA